MEAPEEIALIEAWRAGDERAGDRLVRSHYASVLRFFELKVTAAAADLTQRTFLACVEGKHRYRGDGSFKGYLFGVARHVLFAHLRAAKQAQMVSWSDSAGGSPAASMSTVVARRQEELMLLRALAALDMDYQVALGLHYFEGLKAREIADALEVPVSTVTTRLSRGRAMLRDHVRQQELPGPAREALLADVDGWAGAIQLTPGLQPPSAADLGGS